MRLKQLELVGFKSFPGRTVLEFPAGVTGIVGPNGCGKSNIVDSVRWVLGEQSAKHLRGDSMESVVFNGNERQAPLGMAEVSLTFENDQPSRAVTDLDREMSDLPAQFRDLSEVMITRRYHRSGESEYFINKTNCRLKDITELFLGTGVGSKAYAIIEQGRVSELVNAKPEDRRLFIEEAAGTTLYRSRKLAAERKMERTRENLSRVTDILSEIDRQRRSIERQAKKAETHRRLSDELREIELRVVARQVDALSVQAGNLESRRGELRIAEAETDSQVQAGEERRSRAEASRAEADQRLSALRESLAVLESERQNLRERVELLAGERDERARRRDRLSAEIEAAREHHHEIGGRMVTTERERDESLEALRQDEERLSTGEHELAAAESAVSEVQSRIEAEKNELVAHVALQAQAHNAQSSLQHRGEDIERQLARLGDEDRALEGRIDEAGKQAAVAREVLEGLRQKLASATAEQERSAQEVRRHAEERRRLDRQVSEFEGQLVQARSRLESLEEIQSRYEGFERGVRSIMGADVQESGVLGVVADVIDIPQEYERAAAAVLGERLQYVIVREEEVGAGAVDRLRREEQGRGSFIPLHPRLCANGAAQMNGASKRMLELVHFDESFRSVAESLLGDVVVVPDLTTAVSAWKEDGGPVTLVTPDGDVMQPSGVITGGSDRPVEEEILARRREIEALRTRAEETGLQLDRLKVSHAEVSAELEKAEEAVRSVGEGAHDLTVEIVAAEKDIERIEYEIPEYTSRREVLRYEVENLKEEVGALRQSLVDQKQEVDRLEARSAELELAAVETRRTREGTASRAEALRSEVTAMKIRVAERRERKQSVVTTLESLVQQQQALRGREVNLAEDLESCGREHQRLTADIEEAQRREKDAEERQTEIRSTQGGVAAEVEERTEALRAEIESSSAARGTLDTLRRELQEIEIAHSEARLRKEHLISSIQEKYECDVPSWTAPEDGEGEDADVVAKEAEQVEHLRHRLLKMGDVNAAAIDELRELEERSEFLTTQRDDLERSLADLEKTIQKLNRASRTRFAETFAKANETFQQVFPRLFRGGEGRLVLTDEHNLLESGVDIIVRPPGKRLDNVNLLSGGEKALVAVSLIFSLFMINPTPFCILDEVDAPLDDANIGRFSQMVAEMSAHSQFVIVTHNKRTMESANVLYGVTMPEPGVSRLVSVAMS